MKHIFSVHSTITAICAKLHCDVLKNNKEDCVILTSRGFKWPFSEISIIDVTPLEVMMENSKNQSHNVYSRIKNRIKTEKHIKNKVKEILGDETFLLYTPHLSILMARNFLSSKKCLGYYFVEEGTMSYQPLGVISRDSELNYPLYVKLFHFFLGAHSYKPYDYTDKRFQGTIAISDKAFLWNTKKRTVYDKEELSVVVSPVVDIIIICGYLDEDISLIDSIFDAIYSNVKVKTNSNKIGVKFHPVSYAKWKDKVNYLSNRWEGRMVILPSSYIGEFLLFKHHPVVYNVLEFSSLSMYALTWGCEVYMVTEDLQIIKKEP